MSQKLVVKTTSDPFLFQWVELPLLGFPASAEREIGTLAELSTELQSQPKTEIYFVAPATSVLVKQISFSSAEKKHLAKTIPFALEEEMICDVNDLHCVLGKPGEDKLWVAAVQRQDLEGWLHRFAEVNLNITQCIPEQVLLLQQDAECVIYYENGEFLLRHSHDQLHGVDAQNIALALELATDGFANLPTRIDLLLNKEDEKEIALEKIPAPLHGRINAHVKPLPALVNQRIATGQELNLLQGDYRKSKSWDGALNKWKAPLILLAAAIAVNTGVSYAENVQLEKKIKTTNKQVQEFCQQVLPKCSTKQEARKQLNKELERLGGGTGASFLASLSSISASLQKQQDYKINSLTYNGDKKSVELNVLLKDFPAVENLKTAMQNKNLDVNLANSNAQGDQVRARLIIKSAETQ